MRKLLLYIFILAAAVGCVEYPYGQDPVVGVAEVTFAVTMPNPAPAETRAFADTDVENIDILVFDNNNKFVERIRVDQIAGAGATKSFSLKLDYTPDARTFHIIANGRTAADVDRLNFSAITPQMLESAAIPALRTNTQPTLNEASITPLVMWGRVKLNSITQPVITVNDAKLLRATAAITAKNMAGADFVISRISLAGVPEYGFVAPAGYTAAASVPTTPNLPSGNVSMKNYTDNNYWAAGAEPQIYMYERKNSDADHVSIILQGSYKGTSGYYKIVLAQAGNIYLDVVRNHRYIVHVMSVSGPGYANYSDALANPPSNMFEYQILDTRDDIFLIVTDGRNELGVSINHLELRGLQTGTSVEIASLFATRNSSLAIQSYPSNLTNVNISAAQSDGTRKLTATWSSNTTVNSDIVVTDGHLKHNIKVVATTDYAVNNVSDNSSVATYQLAGAANKPWSAWIVQGDTNRARLHYQKSAIGFSASNSWGYKAIESRMSTTAYLHVLKSSGNNYAIVQYSCPDDTGELRVGRIIVGK